VAVPGLQIILFNQVSNDFGVGFGSELVALGNQLFLERKIVFDDAIVDDDDLAGAVAMRVGVLLSGTAVGGPAGVSDAIGAVERLDPDDFFKIAQFALGAAHLQAGSIAGDGDARGVVAAVLELSEAFDDDINDWLVPYVSHNAAHLRLVSLAKATVGNRDVRTATRRTASY